MILTDNRITKAFFRDCPISDRQQFKYSHSLLPISIGQPAHEGKKLESTLKLVNNSFNQCTILLGDTLQRHNLKLTLNLPECETREKANTLGEEWLERNHNIIKNTLKIRHNLLRWDTWLNHYDFKNQLAKIEDLYSNNTKFKHAFDTTIDEYLERNPTEHNTTHFKKASLDYLKEECAVMILWASEHYDFEIYPNGRNTAMAITYEHLIRPYNSSLLRPVALRFKKYHRNLATNSNFLIPNSRGNKYKNACPVTI